MHILESLLDADALPQSANKYSTYACGAPGLIAHRLAEERFRSVEGRKASRRSPRASARSSRQPNFDCLINTPCRYDVDNLLRIGAFCRVCSIDLLVPAGPACWLSTPCQSRDEVTVRFHGLYASTRCELPDTYRLVV